MLIKYYNNPELAYTTRKRYRTFNFVPFNQEEQKSILLGDGANTTVKTNKKNICNYVQIDNTRWYVMYYTYMNGSQVELYLQRDVIGEFGLGECFGKIERGYTDNILKYRKELNLNQILKKREYLLPNTMDYGNFLVDTHLNEMWGILYIVKPADGKTNLTINLPGFAPDTVEYPFIENGTEKPTGATSDCSISFRVRFTNSPLDSYGHYPVYQITINFQYSELSNAFVPFDSKMVSVRTLGGPTATQFEWDILLKSSITALSDTELMSCAKEIGVRVGNAVFNNPSSTKGYSFPSLPQGLDAITKDYNGVTIKKDDTFYEYTTTENSRFNYGSTARDKMTFYVYYIRDYVDNKQITVGNKTTTITIQSYTPEFPSMSLTSRLTVYETVYTYRILTSDEAGQVTLDLSKQLIDEPFTVLVVPLYNVIISGDDFFDISGSKAFSVFNGVIEGLSGESGSLVDAQIYPYCPVLTKVAAKYKDIPFFSISSSCYDRYSEIQLLPSSDIKKEYIEREYSIVSPEQSSKFSFNFYDYITDMNDIGGTNYAKMTVTIKTALKPFGIISSAVINRNNNSLKGISYLSDLVGSQPTSNGFECSLSSNAFETYRRQNSNFQQIFNLDKEELQKQHEIENINNITATVVNSVSATAMGAIAGASLADQIAGTTATRAIGGIAGGLVAGGTVAGMMGWQTTKNQEIMAYEETLQQQRFDFNIGTIKNIPNSINRVSSFNEIILKDFWYVMETYECSAEEKVLVDNFIERYGYGIGVFDYIINYHRDGWFLRSTLISSSFAVKLHNIAEKELSGGIYYYEQA